MHSTTYGNLRKERKFARSLYIGIGVAVLVGFIAAMLIGEARSLYPFLPGSETRPMPTQ